jgi:hypothetical protein
LKKIIFFITVSFLFARLNPFEPVITPENITKVKPEYFKKAVVYLPSDARVLKKIIFVYQNINSDILKKEVNINKNIDFHSPIIITHNPKNFGFRKVYLKYFTMYIKNKKVFIKTKDPLIRAFFLIAPFRLVLDFKRKTDFATVKKNLNTFIKKVVIGSHGSFYRAVLYLDANYKYRIKKLDEGIEIEFF